MKLNATLKPSIRQKKLARLIANGTVKTAKEALLNVGYSETVATHKPKEILDSKGVTDELQRLGFTAEHAKAKLASIMNAPVVSEMITPDNQLRAIDMVLKVFGAYAPDKSISVTATLAELIEQAKKPKE